MAIRRSVPQALLFGALLFAASCGDSGSDPASAPAGLTVSSTALSLQPGDTARLTLGGGAQPYAVATPPAAGVATASLAGATLTVAALAQGSTSVTVRDASSPAQSATVQVTVGAPPAISFSGEVQPIFDANCTGCHGGTANLFLTAAQSYASLVNVTAQTGACAGVPRVAPRNSAGSALYRRVNGTCSERMPLGGSLTAGQIELIRRWIDEGAANN